MSKSIEDILVCIHDESGQDEHTKLGRMVREVSAHLVPFGHYTSTERVRIARAIRDKNLGTQLSDGIADMTTIPQGGEGPEVGRTPLLCRRDRQSKCTNTVRVK
jgi:hypothetical protein